MKWCLHARRNRKTINDRSHVICIRPVSLLLNGEFAQVNVVLGCSDQVAKLS